MELEDAEVIGTVAVLQSEGRRYILRVPKKGSKEKLVELAEKNASLVLTQDKEKINVGRKAVPSEP